MTANRFAVFLSLCAIWTPLSGQTPEPPAIHAQLELTVDVSTTTEEGYPSSLRATIRNVGAETLDMPVLTSDCSPDNGLRVDASWVSDDRKNGSGSGGSCGMGDQGSLMSRIQRQWVRLRPGEFMTQTINLLAHYDPAKSGTVYYRVIYIPPSATKLELEEALSAGYVIPAKRLDTGKQSFRIH